MNKPVTQFIVSILFIVALCLAIRASESDLWVGISIGSFVFLGLPFLILSWIDFGDHLRSLRTTSMPLQILIFIFGIPQALFGLGSLGIGIGIVLWVIYNSFIEQQEEYSGGFMTLGLSPMFIGFGLFLLLSAFKRNKGV
ncbi:hypothetical protein [Marinobacter halophilus]|uniref:Uncharacterized protein n=1 Tax=Marinobacter halophilus TaxID=1323740 RepID=A0A2T1KHA7_9GAMM|nr:hypothetical protein [Marinobacter halophilus]PSF09514.1 hypothetical protein C7H08_03245 [Marinobacter halophilus]